MKKKRIILISVIASAILIAVSVVAIILLTGNKGARGAVKSAEAIGIGGYGAVFDASVDPFNKDNFAFASDMGGVYFSYDRGKSFSRHNLMGRIYDIEYDNSKEGVVWLCGSGVFKSEDGGKSVKMVFPQENDLDSGGRNFENMHYWLYDVYKDGDPKKYPYSRQMRSIAVNEASNGQNVFVSSHYVWEKNVVSVYETKNGNDFSLFYEMETNGATGCEVFYCERDGVLLLLITYSDKTEIWGIDGNKNAVRVYSTDQKILDFDKYYDARTHENLFAFTQTRETGSLGDGSDYDKYVRTDVFKVSNFNNKASWENLAVNLTDAAKGIPNSFKEGKDDFVFDWELSELDVVDRDNVYLFQKTKTASGAKVRMVYGYVKYSGGKFSWIFGYPYKPHTQISNVSWQDGDQPVCYGVSGTAQDDGFLLFGTVVGLYYAENNGEKIVQCNSDAHGEITLQTKNSAGDVAEQSFKRYSSTGVDVQTTYEVVTDPFDLNHLAVTCTDIGLVHSFDNGKTWIRNVANLSPDFRNTCYDFEFDREKKGVAYAIWCGKHDAPYTPDQSYLSCTGKFGISYDAGLTWEFYGITGDDKVLPYRMFIEYSGGERTVYLATEGRGFFVSRNGGKSFSPFNGGVKSKTFYGQEAIFANDILKCGEGIFAVVSGLASEADSALYRFDEGANTFREIALPENCGCVRDIVYSEKEKCLYLAVVGNRYVKGGVLRYKDGEFGFQIEKESFFGVSVDLKGRLYATSLESRVYRFNGGAEPEILPVSLHHSLKTVCFGADGKTLFVTSFGGGVCRIRLNY